MPVLRVGAQCNWVLHVKRADRRTPADLRDILHTRSKAVKVCISQINPEYPVKACFESMFDVVASATGRASEQNIIKLPARLSCATS